MAGHSRFLLYGDFVRLSFLNWLVPELHARGWRTELLHLSGNDMLFLASRNLSATGPADPAGPAGVLTGASTGTLTRDRQATHAQQPVLAR
jgi:hypothetical protein